MLPDINLRLFRFRTRQTTFHGVVQMAKTRRRVSRKKTRKVRKVKRGGSDTDEHFEELLGEYVENGKKAVDKSGVVSAFNSLSPDSKANVLKGLGIKNINGVSNVSYAKVYSYIRQR
jgi:hypothetical protein